MLVDEISLWYRAIHDNRISVIRDHAFEGLNVLTSLWVYCVKETQTLVVVIKVQRILIGWTFII